MKKKKYKNSFEKLLTFVKIFTVICISLFIILILLKAFLFQEEMDTALIFIPIIFDVLALYVALLIYLFRTGRK